ncbi:MAG: tRNA (adenosine(37)-N6)-threonylcarbamoyltransferase complex dimerization subunit type 1 TsaB [Defluviitaleaceae bacterium]|nr:tRNA (adenosine(37)-N6)-threonylcarbamoyltransferase complex dimerization subunit type 1 TsaB [Defluviitaleaceae bacterium]
MKILAIDTSGEQGSAAIIGAKNADTPYITIGEILFNARTGEKFWTHSEALMPGVEKLFELTRLEPSDMDYIAYANGPGSFTGLRIGASSAIAMARALEIPAIAVPTLDALAYNAVGMGARSIIVPMLDARRKQVYTAIYFRDTDGSVKAESEFMAIYIEEILQRLDQILQNSIIFLGDGAEANEKIIRDKFPTALFAPLNNSRLRAASVGMCAVEKIRAAGESSDEISGKISQNMIYIRAPQAVREAATREATTK